jgi:hypothetical protein
MSAPLDVVALSATVGWSVPTARRYAAAWHAATLDGRTDVPRTALLSPAPRPGQPPPRPRYAVDADGLAAWLYRDAACAA